MTIGVIEILANKIEEIRVDGLESAILTSTCTWRTKENDFPPLSCRSTIQYTQHEPEICDSWCQCHAHPKGQKYQSKTHQSKSKELSSNKLLVKIRKKILIKYLGLGSTVSDSLHENIYSYSFQLMLWFDSRINREHKNAVDDASSSSSSSSYFE